MERSQLRQAPKSVAQVATEDFGGKTVIAGEALVKFSGGVAPVLQLRKESLELVERVGGTGVYLLRSSTKSATSLVTSLRKRKDVIYAEPNYLFQAQTIPNDERFGEMWPLWNTGQTILGVPGTPGADIGTFNAWDFVIGSRDHVVAVLDTGVDQLHPDLVSNLWTASAAFTIQLDGKTLTCAAGTHGFDTIKRNCDPSDDNQHGTQMVGIIGAEGNNTIGISGVNWIASVMPVKFLDSRGQGTTSNAIDAIEVAIRAKLAGLANVRVIAAGWGDHVFSRALMDAVERAFMYDILFVASAGNDASDNDLSPVYPASFALPNVISATATNNQDTLYSQSNRGANSVHLGAPGAFVLTTIPGGYDYGTGSSLAAAHVAGAAALVLSLCPDLGAADLRDTLLTNVQPLPALVGLVQTRGRLSAEHALGACDRPAFKLTPAAVSFSVARGDSVSVGVQVDPTAGYVGDVTMEVDGLPAGAGASYVPPIVSTPGSATLVITTTDSVSVGTYLLTLRGRDIGDTVRTTPVWLEVTRRRR